MKLLYLSLALALFSANCTFTMGYPSAFIIGERAAVESANPDPILASIALVNEARNKYAAIKELFDAHDALRIDAIKEIIADYSTQDSIQILLGTPTELPWAFGCARWKPYYPPIKSLQFTEDGILQASAPGVDWGYNFTIRWHLIDGSYSVAHTGYRSHERASLRSYKTTHKSFAKEPITKSHNQLVASVETKCRHEQAREPEIIYCQHHLIKLVMPQSLILKSILLGKPYTQCNKPVIESTVQTPQA